MGSCEANFQSYYRAIEDYGLKFDSENLRKMLHEGQQWGFISSTLFPNVDAQVIKGIQVSKRLNFHNYFGSLRLNWDLLKELGRFEKRVLVSNASRESSVAILKYFSVFDHFQDVIGPLGGLRPKPYPDLYLEAMKPFRQNTDLITVFEDSEIGLQAANAAGLNSIPVSHVC